MPEFGAHESVSEGLHLAFERIKRVGGDVLQIFTRNQRQWNPAELKEEEVRLFREAHEESRGMIVASHGSYLVNFATSKEELLQKSTRAFAIELQRCQQLGIPYVVLHPGSHGGDGVEAGLHRFVAGLDGAIEQSGTEVEVLVETTAGQGTGLGRSFDELAFILRKSRHHSQLGVCVDTCHIFAAGYDIRSIEKYNDTIKNLDDQVGLQRVKMFHLNDSKKELGSRVDRHEHIGKGAIGLDGFKNLVNDPRFVDMPMVIETPKSDSLEEDRENLKTLRSLVDSAHTV